MVGITTWTRTGMVLVAVLIALGAIFASPAETTAHAAFRSSDPPAGAVITDTPEQIRVTFTEPLEGAGTGAAVLAGDGTDVAGVTTDIDAADQLALLIHLPPGLPDGGYTVSWHNLSAADGHSQQGYFSFSIGDVAAAASSGSTGNAAAVTGWFGTIGGWTTLLGLSLLVGLWPAWLVALRTGLKPVWLPRAAARCRRLTLVGGGVALVGSVVVLAAQAASTNANVVAGIRNLLVSSRIGLLWLGRVGLVVLLIALLMNVDWVDPRRTGLVTGLALVVGAVVPFPLALVSHAAAQATGTAAAVVGDGLHILAMFVWLGGLAGLGVVLVSLLRNDEGSRRQALAIVVPRFSVLALAAWATLIATGFYAAWLEVGGWSALGGTTYGRWLIAKLLLVGVVLGLAAANLLRYSPALRKEGGEALRIQPDERLRRGIRWELVLAIPLLLAASRMASLEPAREAWAAARPGAMVVSVPLGGEASRSAQLTLAPGAAGENTTTLEVTGETLPVATEALLRVSLPERELPPKTVALNRAEGNRFEGQSSALALPGSWSIEVVVRDIGAFDLHGTTTIPLGSTPPAAVDPSPPAPRFGVGGAIGILLAVAGVAGAALVVAGHGGKLWQAGAVAAFALGVVLIAVSRLEPTPTVASEPPLPTSPSLTAATRGDDPDQGDETIMNHAAMADASPSSEAEILPSPGETVAAANLQVTLLPFLDVSGDATIDLVITDRKENPLTDATVAIIARMAEMTVSQTVSAEETSPGHYQAKGVSFAMAGDWRLSVRVAPRGEPSTTIAYEVPISES